MKYINIVLFILLFIATGILYFLHFNSSEKEPPRSAVVDSSKDRSIAYVNIDTLLSRMEMYKDMQEELAKRQSSFESNLAVKYKTFEKNVSDIEKRLNDPMEIVTQIQKEQINQQLIKQRTDLENLHNSYMNQLQQETINANRLIFEFIMNYLSDYTKDKGIQYVFSHSLGGNILYTDSSLDLTSDVLYGLNEKYLREKSMKK